MINFPDRKKKNIDLIPMINIIFLLLIFFMLTGTIQVRENPKVENPISIFASNSKEFEKNTFNITLTEEGGIYLNNKIFTMIELKQELLKLNISTKIIFNADKNSKITDVNKIIFLLKENDFKKVFFKIIHNDE